MASLDILCYNPFNLKNKIMKIEHKKIFHGPSKIWKNVSWPINICLKYFMAPTKKLRSPSYILNVRSLTLVNQDSRTPRPPKAKSKLERLLLKIFSLKEKNNSNTSSYYRKNLILSLQENSLIPSHYELRWNN